VLILTVQGAEEWIGKAVSNAQSFEHIKNPSGVFQCIIDNPAKTMSNTYLGTGLSKSIDSVRSALRKLPGGREKPVCQTYVTHSYALI